MRDARHDVFVHITQDLLDWFAMFGRVVWQRGADLTGTHLRQDGVTLHLFLILRDPIDHHPRLLAEFRRRHMKTCRHSATSQSNPVTISAATTRLRACTLVRHAPPCILAAPLCVPFLADPNL